MTSLLFKPITIRDLEIRNRVWVSPMCQYSAINGVVGEWHRIHLGSFSTGGVGLIGVEATGVSPEARITTVCTGLWNQEQADAFIPIIDFAHHSGAKIAMQLAHAGRKGSTLAPWAEHEIASIEEGGWQTHSASAISYRDFPEPRELAISEIYQITEQFVDAAIRAVAVGFDVIEIHAAHGYLFHQFYSPLTNQRSDEYGGSFDKRIKFLLETSQKVREAIGEKIPLFVRISASDWVDGGWDLKASIELCKKLKQVGVDLIDVTSGGITHDAKVIIGPGYQVPFARAIKEQVPILTSAVGMITESNQAEEIIKSGSADAVMLARAMLRHPRWAMSAAEELGERISWPIQLERARTINPRKSPQ